MQVDIYKEAFNSYLGSTELSNGVSQMINLLKGKTRVFFIGNGGSNAICSHMMEDYAKIARFETFSFSDAALITCFSNDYGYEKAIEEWLKIHFKKEDLLVSISSSGSSENILNATRYAKSVGGEVVTLSGFKKDNKLRTLGNVNFYVEEESYGIVECIHHTILHIVLDKYSS